MINVSKIITIGSLLGMVALAVCLGIQGWSNGRRIAGLQNELARRDETIQVQKDVYAKQTLQLSDLKSSLDSSTEAGRRLAAQIESDKSQLLSVTNALVKLRRQIADGKGQQQETPDGRTKVSFDRDFGFIRVDGYTVTNPPEYHLSLSQGKTPLKLNMVIEQLPDMSWRSLLASSDENVSFDIGITAVNPYILKPRWYESLKLNLDLGMGDGILSGVGGTFQVGNFEVGPKIWALTSDGRVFKGATVIWAPFKR